jgi:hypothetical protein
VYSAIRRFFLVGKLNIGGQLPQAERGKHDMRPVSPEIAPSDGGWNHDAHTRCDASRALRIRERLSSPVFFFFFTNTYRFFTIDQVPQSFNSRNLLKALFRRWIDPLRPIDAINSRRRRRRFQSLPSPRTAPSDPSAVLPYWKLFKRLFFLYFKKRHFKNE